MTARAGTNGRSLEDRNAFVGIQSPEVRGRRQASKATSDYGKIQTLRQKCRFRAEINNPRSFTPFWDSRYAWQVFPPDAFFDRLVTLFCGRGSNQGLELQKAGTDEGWR